MSAQIKFSNRVQMPKPVPNPKQKKFANIFPLESKDNILREAKAERELWKTGDEDPAKLQNVLAALKKTKKGSMTKPSFEENPEDICIFKDVGDLSNFEISPEFSFKEPEPPKEDVPPVEEEEKEEEIDMEIPKFKTIFHEQLLILKMEIDRDLKITKHINTKRRCEDYCKKITEIRLQAREDIRVIREEGQEIALENIKWRREKEEEATRIAEQVEAEYSRENDLKLEAVVKKIEQVKLEEKEVVARHSAMLQPIRDSFALFTAENEKLANLYSQRGSVLRVDVSEAISALFMGLIKKSQEDVLTEKEVSIVQMNISLAMKFLESAAENIPDAVIYPSPPISQPTPLSHSNIPPAATTVNVETVALPIPIIQPPVVTVPVIQTDVVTSPDVKPEAVTSSVIQAETLSVSSNGESNITPLKQPVDTPDCQIIPTEIKSSTPDSSIPELREAEERFFRIKQKIEHVIQLANAGKNDSPVWLNLAKAAGVISQVKNKGNDPSNRNKLQQVYNLLGGRTCYVGSIPVGTEGHAPACAFIANHISQNIVNLAHDLQVSCVPIYATLIVKIWISYPEVGELIYGRLCEVCPFLVPLTLTREEGKTTEEFERLMGFRVDEPLDKYLARMGAAAQLYGWIVSMATEGNPHGISEGWKFLARLLRKEPFPNVTASILFGFLTIAGNALLRAYGKQFGKILYYIGIVYLPKLEAITVEGGGSDLEGLKNLLIKFHQTKVITLPEEGYSFLI